MVTDEERKILSVLRDADGGWMSYDALGGISHTPPAGVAERVARLEEEKLVGIVVSRICGTSYALVTITRKGVEYCERNVSRMYELRLVQ
jgi:hypothetical protein